MAKDLANPLQALIAGASQTLPKATGATERYAARLNNNGPVVIVCDCSGSMAASAGSARKIDLLKRAVISVTKDLPDAVVIAFNSVAEVTSSLTLPLPMGGTALDKALRLAAIQKPSKTVVISDGRPDDEDDALAAARNVSGVIDVIYCGPDGDAQALSFMRRLAGLGCGACVVCDVVRDNRLKLEPAIRQSLGLPAPKGHQL